MASTDVIDGDFLDAAEKDTTGGDIQKKASIDGSSKEFVNDAKVPDPASDEHRQSQDTQQEGSTIINEERELQNVEREQQEEQLPSEDASGTPEQAEAAQPEKVEPEKVELEEEAVVKLTVSEESKEASKNFRKEHVKLGKSDRNILENPSDLYVLIQHKKWGDALKQVKKNFAEASEWTYRIDKQGNIMWRLLPLHASIILNAPEKLIKALLTAYPRGVQCQDDLGMLPIHLAFRAGISPNIASMLLQAYPQATEVRDFKGRRPLGLAQASSSPHRQEFLHLLKPQSISFTKAELAAVRDEAVAAVSEEKQAAFDRQVEAMKKAHQLEIERLQAEAAKMNELNKSLQKSMALQAETSLKEETTNDVAKEEKEIQDKSEPKESSKKKDPDFAEKSSAKKDPVVGAEDPDDSLGTLVAVHTKLAQMERAHKTEIAAIVAEAESKEEQLERLVNEHFTALEELKGKMGEMEDEHKHVVNRLIEDQKMKVKETQLEYEGGNSKVIEGLRMEIRDMSVAHEEEVNRIKEKFAFQQAKLEVEIAEEREMYQKRLNEVKESLDEKSEFGGASLCGGDLENVASEEDKNATKIQELENKLNQLEHAKIQLVQNHAMEMEALKERTASKVNKLQEALKELKDETAKQAIAMEADMKELQLQLNNLVNSKKESTQALSETLDLLESQEMHWTKENEELQEKIEQSEAALASKIELNSKLQSLIDEQTKEIERVNDSSQEREQELLKTTGILATDMEELKKTLEVEEAKTKLLQEEVSQMKTRAESMQAIIDAERETSQIMAAQHEQVLAHFESKIKTLEVDLAAEKAQTGLLQVQVSQLKDKELSMDQTLQAERETNEILANQLEETTTKLHNGPSKEKLDALKDELEAARAKLAEKEEEEKETNVRVQEMLEKEINLNKHIESLVEKMMEAKNRSREIETKMVRQLETLQTEKNALQGTIMVLSRSLTQQQDEMTFEGNESI